MTIKERQCLLYVLGYYKGDVDGIWGTRSKAATKSFQWDFFKMESKVDGVCGTETEKAMKHAVCYGIPATKVEKPEKDNNAPSAEGTFWDEIEFFTREEFRCQCGGKYCNGFHVEPDETMVRLCNEIRRRSGVPILIRDAGGSGLRCPQWNATIPGAATNSYHTKGMAADLHPRGKTPAQLYDIAEAVMAEMIPGRGGLGLYSWGIHVDTGKYSRWNG